MNIYIGTYERKAEPEIQSSHRLLLSLAVRTALIPRVRDIAPSFSHRYMILSTDGMDLLYKNQMEIKSSSDMAH